MWDQFMRVLRTIERWHLDRARKCVECGAPVERGFATCSDECAAEYASSTAY